MSLFKILLIFAFIFWIFFLWSRRKYYKFLLELPGPMGLPIIGILFRIRSLEGVFRFAEGLRPAYKSPALTWLGPVPILGVWDPQTAQDILTSQNCVNRAYLYDPICDVLGKGLLTLPSPVWQVHRKLLNPAFNTENLRSFLPIFNDKTKAFIKDFEDSYRGDYINILPMMQRLTMYTAFETTMGLKSNANCHSNDGKEEKLYRVHHYFADKVMAMLIMPWCRFHLIRKFVPSFKAYSANKLELKTFFKNEIQEKLKLLSTTDAANMKLNKTNSSDDGLDKRKVHLFFDLTIDLMRSGKFTAQHAEDHLNHIVFGAFETTATSITNVLILLAMNPQCQEIAFEELSTFYADRDNVTVTEDDLLNMVYLDMVVNEALRLITTVPFIGRTTTSDVPLSNGIVVPKGTEIIINVFGMHREESIWGPNALIFNPQNFLPENMRDKHTYAYIPFLKGIRNCIGWRYGLKLTKVVVAILLRKYRFTTTSKFEDLRFSPAITSRHVVPPLLQFHLREK